MYFMNRPEPSTPKSIEAAFSRSRRSPRRPRGSVVHRLLQRVQDRVGKRREDQVGLGGRHSGLDGAFGIEVARPISISVSDFTICVEDRWIMVTSTKPASYSAASDVVGRIVRSDDDDRAAPRSDRARGAARNDVCSPLKVSCPGTGHVGLAGHPRCEDQLFRRSTISLPSRSTTTVHSFRLRPGRALGRRAGPVFSSITFGYISSHRRSCP